jgi:hypothetical protein
MKFSLLKKNFLNFFENTFGHDYQRFIFNCFLFMFIFTHYKLIFWKINNFFSFHAKKQHSLGI